MEKKNRIIRAINLNNGEALDLQTLTERLEFNMLANIGQANCPAYGCTQLCGSCPKETGCCPSDNVPEDTSAYTTTTAYCNHGANHCIDPCLHKMEWVGTCSTETCERVKVCVQCDNDSCYVAMQGCGCPIK